MTIALLIIGGTGDAADLAERLADAPRLRVTTSLAGRTRKPRAIAGEVRVGGFGGSEGLCRYIEAARIDLVVDASHPFATQISAQAAEACVRCGIERVQLRRRPWQAQPGDCWTRVDSMQEAVAAMDPRYKNVFVSTGHKDLSLLPARTDVRFVVRLVEEPTDPMPLTDVTLVLARGPFTEPEERRLLQEHGIDLLISKNSGGLATYAKINAARALEIPVLMIDAPAPEIGATVESVQAAHDWVMARGAAAAAP